MKNQGNYWKGEVAMANQNRLTVLLGAGAMMEVTPLSCQTITEKVINQQQGEAINDKYVSTPVLRIIYERLQEYYQDEKGSINFEDILHTLEMLGSIKTAKSAQVKEFRSIFGMICDLKEEFQSLSGISINLAEQNLIDVVIESVAEFEDCVNKKEWFPKFFKQLQERWTLDVFNLNYDTWIEQILGKYNDGFYPVCETHQKFSANQLFENPDNLPTVNHLHGQIGFTTHLPDHSFRFLISGWYKANNYDVIRDLKVIPKYPGFRETTQPREQILHYPIITGLRKNDKITIPPFDAYYTHFYQQLRKNENLLIIGYSFGDRYINSLLKQFYNFHQESGKVIIIDFTNEQKLIESYPNSPFSHQMTHTIAIMTNQSEPFRLGFNYCDYIETNDKKNRIYLCGFKKAGSTYKDDIFHFFEG